jgi:diacylglycerol kinase family enzyme
VGRANVAVFLIAAGMGLDARIMRDANRELKNRWGKLAYVFTAVRNLQRANVRYVITVDGHRMRRSAQMIMIANLGRITAGLELVPSADPTDGLLEVAILRSRRLPDLARLAWRMLTGHTTTDDVLQVYHGRRILVETKPAQPWQIDGNEAGSTTRLEVEVEPGGLWLARPDPPEQPALGAAVVATTTAARKLWVPALVGVAISATLIWWRHRR